jgi:hypothetical protein
MGRTRRTASTQQLDISVVNEWEEPWQSPSMCALGPRKLNKVVCLHAAEQSENRGEEQEQEQN